jgi:hypothetical protein
MRSITVTSLLIAALTSAGCLQQQEGPDLGNALPRGEDVQVKLPDSAAASQLDDGRTDGDIGSTRLEELGQVADYYLVTRNVTRGLNFSVGWVLLVVHVVVQFPPTTVDGNVYTWGPHSDALDPSEWMLIVTEHQAGQRYTWQLDGRDKTTAGSEFHTMISGEAFPGAEPHRGVGSFVIDFDEAELANPVDNQGKRGTVSVEYDLENRDDTQASVDMLIDGFEPDENGIDRAVSFDYHYGENLDTSGDFAFGVHADLGEGALFEDAEITSSWDVTGAGRAVLEISGGDLGAISVSATECWDTSFRRVYYADSQQWAPTEGDEASCAF